LFDQVGNALVSRVRKHIAFTSGWHTKGEAVKQICVSSCP